MQNGSRRGRRRRRAAPRRRPSDPPGCAPSATARSRCSVRASMSPTVRSRWSCGAPAGRATSPPGARRPPARRGGPRRGVEEHQPVGAPRFVAGAVPIAEELTPELGLGPGVQGVQGRGAEHGERHRPSLPPKCSCRASVSCGEAPHETLAGYRSSRTRRRGGRGRCDRRGRRRCWPRTANRDGLLGGLDRRHEDHADLVVDEQVGATARARCEAWHPVPVRHSAEDVAGAVAGSCRPGPGRGRPAGRPRSWRRRAARRS